MIVGTVLIVVPQRAGAKMTDQRIAWAQRWPQAAAELAALTFPSPSDQSKRHGMVDGTPEMIVVANVRLEASQGGHLLYRNNVGAGTIAESGSFLRWGLANESKRVNTEIKSGDLIGLERVLITPEMVGAYFGRFLSREIKRPGWKYTGTPEERAQLNWANIINSRGGNAAFVTGLGSL